MSNNTDIQKYIVQCDPGFVGYTEDGHYRLNRLDDDTEQEHEIVMTPAEYVEEHPITVEEEMFAVIHIMLDRIAHTTITPSSMVIDTLLDIKSLFVQYRDQTKSLTSQLMKMLSEE